MGGACSRRSGQRPKRAAGQALELAHRKLWLPCDAMQSKAAQARARAEWLLTCGPVPCRCSSGRCSSGSSSAPSMTLSLHGPRRSRSLPLLRSVRRRMLLINSLTAIAPRRRRRIIALEAIYSMRGARAGKMPISIDNRSPDFQRQGCNRRAWDMSALVVYRARRTPHAACTLPCRLQPLHGRAAKSARDAPPLGSVSTDRAIVLR